MSENLVWGFGLFAGAILLFFLEILIPSGGIIGVAAGVVAISAVVAFWMENAYMGAGATLFLIILIPIAFQFAIKVIPNTPFGRMLILGSDDDDEREQFNRARAEAEEHERVQSLIGRTGVAHTDLRPVGSAEFDGEYLQVISQLGVIEAGAPVVITDVQGSTIKVRPA